MLPSDIHPYLHEVYNKATSDRSATDHRDFTDSFFCNWVGEFLHPYGDELFNAGTLNHSLIYCYLAAQSMNFHWYEHSLNHGAYTMVFREFRCILEGLFIVYKIEKTDHQKTLHDKLQILADAEEGRGNFGRQVFKSSGFSDWSIYYDIYSELSSYIHLSYSRTSGVISTIMDQGFPEALDYSYDRTRFIDACRIWRKIASLAIEMAQQLAQLDSIDINVDSNLFNH